MQPDTVTRSYVDFLSRPEPPTGRIVTEVVAMGMNDLAVAVFADDRDESGQSTRCRESGEETPHDGSWKKMLNHGHPTI